MAELDSVATRRLYRDTEESLAEVDALLIGGLRMAYLLSDEILLTAAMVLDSMFFQRVGPSQLAESLGVPRHRLPLRVLYDEASLADALASKLACGDDFTWQLAGPDPVAGWVTEDIREGWARWIDAEARGDLAAEPLTTWPDQTAKVPFEMVGEVSTLLEDPAAIDLAATTHGRRRSLIFEAYRRSIEANTDKHLRGELRRIRDAYNTSYFDAMARQHEAEWISVTGSVHDVAQASDRAMLRVSGDLVVVTRTLPPAVFAHVLTASTVERSTWLAMRRRRDLWALTYKVNAVLTHRGLREDLLGVLRSVVLALLAVLVAVPELGDQARWLPWAIFIVTAMVAVPWQAGGVIRDLMPRSLDAGLSINRA